MKTYSNHKQKNSVTSTLSLLALLLTTLACSSGGGGGASSAASPYGLFLRPTGETDVKVYSNGQGLLLENSDGSTNEIVIGTFDHDDVIEAHAKDSDGVSITNSYKLLDTLSHDYDDFSITKNNQLSFIGANSGDYAANPRPTHKLSIETTTTVGIDLPSTFDGYIGVDASGDTEDSDTREFSFSVGTITIDDVATVGEVAAHRTISVTAGKIYVADTTEGTAKTISFNTLTDYALPITEDIYDYHVIVTDESNDGTGDVSAVAELPTDDTEFYMLGTVGAHAIPSITIDGITFTDKSGDGVPKIKFTFKVSTGVTVEIVNGDTISIETHLSSDDFGDLLEALKNPANGVTALIDVTTTGAYNSGKTIQNGDIGRLQLSGGVDGANPIKAQTEIAGLIIEAATAGVAGNNIDIVGEPSGVADSTISISQPNTIIFISYGSDATLADMITAINTGISQAAIDANALINFVGTAGTDYDSATKLADVLFASYSLAEDGTPEAGADPTANDTGTEQTGVYNWETADIFNIEDYIINLSPQ